jgi:hypothetical protein
MATMLPDHRKAARIFGAIAGAAVGIETLFPEAMCCGGMLTGIFFMFTLPGMFASAIIVGNIHAYPTWLAGVVNALLYYFLGSLLWRLIASIAMRVKGIDSN